MSREAKVTSATWQERLSREGPVDSRFGAGRYVAERPSGCSNFASQPRRPHMAGRDGARATWRERKGPGTVSQVNWLTVALLPHTRWMRSPQQLRHECDADQDSIAVPARKRFMAAGMMLGLGPGSPPAAWSA
jgi:hypothetical protein